MAMLGWSAIGPLAYIIIQSIKHPIRQSDPTRTRLRFQWLWVIPWVFVAVAIGISIINPAYESYAPSGGKQFQYIEHVPYLPATVDIQRTGRQLFLLTGLMVLCITLFYTVRSKRNLRLLLIIFS